MGYFENLKELLRPLRLYDLDVGSGKAELAALGHEMDELQEVMEELEREAVASTASGYGLAFYEQLMPFVPEYRDTIERRGAISALLRIDDMGFTERALNGTVAGCGMEALVSEGDEAETVTVSILNTRGIPEDFSRISRRIEQILPCHLEIIYSFIYSSWNELMAYFGSWTQLQQKVSTWREFEIYTEN